MLNHLVKYLTSDGLLQAQVTLHDLMTNGSKCLLSSSDESPFAMDFSTPPVIPPVDFEVGLNFYNNNNIFYLT